MNFLKIILCNFQWCMGFFNYYLDQNEFMLPLATEDSVLMDAIVAKHFDCEHSLYFFQNDNFIQKF